MTHRTVMTLAAFLVAMALSASAVVAAPSTKSSAAATHSGSCGAQASERILAAKPAKDHPDKGKHVGQTKNKPTTEPDESNENDETDETGGDRPHNHGWFVSQVAKDNSVSGGAHGEAVSAVAQSDQGKPEAANP
jgi:hypothetical protein